MKPAPFAYLRPGSLADALAALAEAPDAKVLAGGQSLVPLLSMRLAAPGTLVDINGLPGPGRRHASPTTASGSARWPGTPTCWPRPTYAGCSRWSTMALANVAHPTIRNRGTTVGSLVHADAAAEMPVVLRLLGGSVEVESAARGRRTIPAEELFLGPLESSVRARRDRGRRRSSRRWRPAPGWRSRRSPAGTATTRCAASAALVDGDDRAGAGYLSVSDVPTVVDLTRRRREERWGDAALEQLDPADDIHATADYRAHLVRVLTARVVRAAYDDAKART